MKEEVFRCSYCENQLLLLKLMIDMAASYPLDEKELRKLLDHDHLRPEVEQEKTVE